MLPFLLRCFDVLRRFLKQDDQGEVRPQNIFHFYLRVVHVTCSADKLKVKRSLFNVKF